jgi:hypothetical protein
MLFYQLGGGIVSLRHARYTCTALRLEALFLDRLLKMYTANSDDSTVVVA